MDEEEHEEVDNTTEEEALCAGLSNLDVADSPGIDTEKEKEIAEEIWGAVGQLDEANCDCSWCRDMEDHTPPQKGSSFQIRRAPVYSNEMVQRLGTPTPTIPIKICGGRCLKKQKQGWAPITEIRVCPDLWATTDLISEEMAKKVGMDIRPNQGEWSLTEISGVGTVKLSRPDGK